MNLGLHVYHLLFLCLRYEVAGGIMFSGCPSVRPYVCTSYLVIALSEEPIDEFLPNFGHVCILQSRWTDQILGSRGQRSKATAHIMYAKTARDRVISRTNWWIAAKLRSCMIRAEPMNWDDSWFIKSKVKGHGLIMYAKISCERILIRTDRWITV